MQSLLRLLEPGGLDKKSGNPVFKTRSWLDS